MRVLPTYPPRNLREALAPTAVSYGVRPPLIASILLAAVLLAGCGGSGESGYLHESEDGGLVYVSWNPTEGNGIAGRMVSLYLDESGQPLEQEETFAGTENDGNVALEMRTSETPVLGEVEGGELRLQMPNYAGTNEVVLRESSEREYERKSSEARERLEERAAKFQEEKARGKAEAAASFALEEATGYLSSTTENLEDHVETLNVELAGLEESIAGSQSYVADAEAELEALRAAAQTYDPEADPLCTDLPTIYSFFTYQGASPPETSEGSVESLAEDARRLSAELEGAMGGAPDADLSAAEAALEEAEVAIRQAEEGVAAAEKAREEYKQAHADASVRSEEITDEEYEIKTDLDCPGTIDGG